MRQLSVTLGLAFFKSETVAENSCNVSTPGSRRRVPWSSHKFMSLRQLSLAGGSRLQVQPIWHGSQCASEWESVRLKTQDGSAR